VVVGTVVVAVIVVVPIITVTNVSRRFAILLNDGEVESDDDGNGSDDHTDGDRTNDELALGLVGRGVGTTLLLQVSVPPVRRDGAGSGEVRIMGIVLVRDGRVTDGGVPVHSKRVECIYGRCVVSPVE
jgi:hypothetical protein